MLLVSANCYILFGTQLAIYVNYHKNMHFFLSHNYTSRNLT